MAHYSLQNPCIFSIKVLNPMGVSMQLIYRYTWGGVGDRMRLPSHSSGTADFNLWMSK